MNHFLFDNQEERAKVMIQDSLVRVLTYGKIPEESIVWNTWLDSTQTERISKRFSEKVYTIGQVALSKEYTCLLSKVVGYENTYCDLYVFNREGRLLSLINMYEEEYERPGNPKGKSYVYTTSSIDQNGIINWHHERHGMLVDRKYNLRSDGYFEIVDQKTEGEFEY